MRRLALAGGPRRTVVDRVLEMPRVAFLFRRLPLLAGHATAEESSTTVA